MRYELWKSRGPGAWWLHATEQTKIEVLAVMEEDFKLAAAWPQSHLSFLGLEEISAAYQDPTV